MKESSASNETLDFLSEKSSYPHNPRQVQIIQTHASYVALVPPYVYKLKKPVDFGFMDFSSTKKRKTNAQSEVYLNRRLAYQIYLGVVPVLQDENGNLQFHESRNAPPHKIVDYAVKMKLLEEEYFFPKMMEQDLITESHLNRIIQKLADFYLHQKPPQAISQFGTPDAVRENTHGNFSVLSDFIGETLTQPAFDAVKYFTDQFYECNEELFYQRMEEKRILDCHGDLRLEHIHLHPDRLSIFDCIEFNDRFRYIDQASDIAFLAMELDLAGRNEWGRLIINRLKDLLEDEALPRMTDFYKVYRACVRCKVESIKSRETEVVKTDREHSRKLADRHIKLALRYALADSGPFVLIVMGPVASGKSTIAKNLANILGWKHMNSDVIRKEMAGLNPNEPSPGEMKSTLYSPENSKKVYQSLINSAKIAAKNKECIILDATFGNREFRSQAIKAFNQLEIPFCFTELSASEETLRERLQQREYATAEASDARSGDIQLLKAYQPPQDIDSKDHMRINSTLSLENNLTRILKELIDKKI